MFEKKELELLMLGLSAVGKDISDAGMNACEEVLSNPFGGGFTKIKALTEKLKEVEKLEEKIKAMIAPAEE